MKVCDKCREYGLNFKRPYDVAEFVEGYPDSPVWIIALNPGVETTWEDTRSGEKLASTFHDLVHDLARKNSYFRNFSRVSEWLYSRLGKSGGVAHTDLVKCSSPSWPPSGCSGSDVNQIVANCTPFLHEQLTRFKPRIVICNGADVCLYIKTAIPPDKPIGNSTTSYRGHVDGVEIWVVLSGFIGRIDNYARMRLGAEVERIAEQIGVKS